MKKLMFFLFAVMLVAAFSCKRTDEVKPAQQTASQPNDSLKIQGIPPLIPYVIAGSNNNFGYTNGIGKVTRFDSPAGLCTTADGSLLVADFGNNAIRKIFKETVVSTFLNLNHYLPQDVAALRDGGVGIATNQGMLTYDRGIIRSVPRCPNCRIPYSICKDATSTFFWYPALDFNTILNTISSVDTHLGIPAPAVLFSRGYDDIIALSVTSNDNKFLAVGNYSIIEITHSGRIITILNFPPTKTLTQITAVVTNHDGSKLYIAQSGVIKLIDRCLTCKGTPIKLTTLTTDVGAYKLALSNSETVLYFTTTFIHHTVNKVVLPKFLF